MCIAAYRALPTGRCHAKCRPSSHQPPHPLLSTTPAAPGPSPQAELGDRYRLFLLEDKEDKPTAVVLPVEAANEGTISKFTEVRGGGSTSARRAAGHGRLCACAGLRPTH
jgi:hypothetical protein